MKWESYRERMVGDMLMTVFNKYYFVPNISQVPCETQGWGYMVSTLMDLKRFWDINNDKKKVC